MLRVVMATGMLLVGAAVFAQHQEPGDTVGMYKGETVLVEDSSSLLSAFKNGHFNGHFRYFFMGTQNQKGLTDYYANAMGGGLRYESARFHGFQFAVSGFYTFNIGSSDLGKADSLTGRYNRYEIGLFDVEDPYNKNDIDRLEELYLKYNYKNSTIIFGKQIISTPFINLQDSRMRPTGVEGIWVEYNGIPGLQMEGGWLYGFSPRSTTRWYRTGASIGIFSTGVNVDGTKSGYQGNLQSRGAFMVGTHIKAGNKLKVHGWNLLAENIFNTALLQADVAIPIQNNSFFGSAQLIRQDAVNNGGNAEAANTYFEKGGRATTFGIRAGWKNKKVETSVNFNRITKNGRFLMPREWGQEPFFTYLSRERNEGLGDVTALMAKVNFTGSKPRMSSSLAAGYYALPDVKNYRLNKYGVPSYIHVRADLQYAFAGVLKGMEAQLLVVSKIRKGETYSNKGFEFNTVNIMLYNLIFNYHF